MNQQKLLGNWMLTECKSYADSHNVDYAFGEYPVGYLFYLPDGHFSVCLMNANRTPLTSNDKDGLSIEDKANMSDEFFAYFGHYEFDGEKVLHHIETCTRPDWIGTTKTRFVEFKNDRLILTTAPFVFNGKKVYFEVVWKRC